MNRFRRVSTGWQRKKKGNEIHFKPTPSTLAVGGVVSDNEVFVQLSLSLSHRQPQASESPSSVPFSSHATLEAHSFPSVLPCEYVLFFAIENPFPLGVLVRFPVAKKKGLPIDYFIFWVPSFFLSLSLSLFNIILEISLESILQFSSRRTGKRAFDSPAFCRRHIGLARKPRQEIRCSNLSVLSLERRRRLGEFRFCRAAGPPLERRRKWRGRRRRRRRRSIRRFGSCTSARF